MCPVLIGLFRDEMKLSPLCDLACTGHHVAVLGGELPYLSLCQLFPCSLFRINAKPCTIQVQTYISIQVDMFQVN